MVFHQDRPLLLKSADSAYLLHELGIVASVRFKIEQLVFENKWTFESSKRAFEWIII